MTPFAKRLEEYFKSAPLDKRLYYERRSNQYDAEKIEKQRIVVHQNLVRSVGAMFLGDAHITTKNFSTLRAQVGERIFNDTDRMEPYYVAAVAWYQLERLFRNRIDARYKPARYQMLLAARLQMDPDSLPPMSSKEIGQRCEEMINVLWNNESEELFSNAAETIDEVAGQDWDRDSVRIEKVTAGIFNKFGQIYHGRKPE